ncbi:hypothetical protein FJTKL_09928 [Diaporthe vaccinii]|uniref:Uncharacterized protein n=1 Tax=Diaporthe vaccinii TaxID=105482 RepID=A0ABR4ELG7_9PEZI
MAKLETGDKALFKAKNAEALWFDDNHCRRRVRTPCACRVMTQALRRNGITNAGQWRMGLSGETTKPLAKLSSVCARIWVRSWIVPCLKCVYEKTRDMSERKVMSMLYNRENPGRIEDEFPSFDGRLNILRNQFPATRKARAPSLSSAPRIRRPRLQLS